MSKKLQTSFFVKPTLLIEDTSVPMEILTANFNDLSDPEMRAASSMVKTLKAIGIPCLTALKMLAEETNKYAIPMAIKTYLEGYVPHGTRSRGPMDYTYGFRTYAHFNHYLFSGSGSAAITSNMLAVKAGDATLRNEFDEEVLKYIKNDTIVSDKSLKPWASNIYGYGRQSDTKVILFQLNHAQRLTEGVLLDIIKEVYPNIKETLSSLNTMGRSDLITDSVIRIFFEANYRDVIPTLCKLGLGETLTPEILKCGWDAAVKKDTTMSFTYEMKQWDNGHIKLFSKLKKVLGISPYKLASHAEHGDWDSN